MDWLWIGIGALVLFGLFGGSNETKDSTKRVMALLQKMQFYPCDTVDGDYEIHFVLPLNYESEFRTLTERDLKFLYSRFENIIANSQKDIRFNCDYARRRFLIGFREIRSWTKSDKYLYS